MQDRTGYPDKCPCQLSLGNLMVIMQRISFPLADHLFFRIFIFMLKWMLKNTKNNFAHVILPCHVLWIFFEEFSLILIILCLENMSALFHTHTVNMHICPLSQSSSVFSLQDIILDLPIHPHLSSISPETSLSPSPDCQLFLHHLACL